MFDKCPKENIQKNAQKNAQKHAQKHAQGRNRTTDTRIFNPLLYRLSYLGVS